MKTIKLVNFFASKLASRCPAGFSFDDAQQEMLIVLMEARRLHTAEHTQTFVTFLENRLRWRYRTLVRLHVHQYKTDLEWSFCQRTEVDPQCYERLFPAVRDKIKSGRTKYHARALQLFDTVTGAVPLPDRREEALSFPDAVSYFGYSKNAATFVKQIIQEAVKEVLS